MLLSRSAFGLAWVVILAVVALVVFRTMGGSPPSETAGIGTQQELAGRLCLGISAVSPAQARLNARNLGDGPIDSIASAIVIAAFDGPDAGEASLEKLDGASDDTVRRLLPLVRDAIARAKSTDEASPMGETDAATLTSNLGWFGDLAIALSNPVSLQEMQESAVRTLVAMMTFGLVMMCVGVAGLVGIVVLITVATKSAKRSWSMRFPGVYAETFALWLALFTIAQVVLLPRAADHLRLLVAIAMFFGSLVVLVWPVVRGVAWSQVRRDVGLTRFSPMEILSGLATYAMSLPFLVVGLTITVVLGFLIEAMGGAVGQPSHPVQQQLSEANPTELLQLFVLAVVAAPVVEEIVFRGVLYTHLRSASRRLPWFVSCGLSAVVAGVIFAVIHPQGLLFAPVLAGMATGFAIGREWRGSIYASIVAHAVNNAVVLGLNVFVIG